MRKIISLFALLFVFQLFVYSQTLDEKLKEIDAYANTVMDTWHGPGMAIAIVKDDKAVFAKGYGVRELGKPDKVDENTLFAIASNSKAFTAASLAILVDEKKIAWNDKVSKYLPDFQMYDPWVTSELTIRDLCPSRRTRYIQRRSALVRHDLFDGRDAAACALSEAGFEFSHPVRLSESDVYRRRPGGRKGFGQAVGRICPDAHSRPAGYDADDDQHQKSSG